MAIFFEYSVGRTIRMIDNDIERIFRQCDIVEPVGCANILIYIAAQPILKSVIRIWYTMIRKRKVFTLSKA